MKTKTLGIVIAIIGVLMMIYTGFSYVTREEVIDLGPMHMSVEKENPVQWSPIVGVVLLIGGIVLVAIDKKK
jgi:drug/metabolite transporter (DMT)-like permease